jgi:hypothetical protein
MIRASPEEGRLGRAAMKRAPWITVLLIAAAMLAIVPTTLAVGEPGTTLYASLGSNRFPAGTGASALAKLRFLNDQTISFDVQIRANQTKLWTARVYSRGSCAAVLNWVVNRGSGDPAGYLDVMSNAGEVAHLLTARDVNRVRAAIARGEGLALMIAGTDNAGATYRTCTAFSATVPPTTTLPPITTSTTSAAPTTSIPAPTTSTTSQTTTSAQTTQATTTQTTPATVTTGTSTGTTTTGSTTGSSTLTTTTSQTTQTSTSISIQTELCITLTLTGDLPFTPPFTSTFTIPTNTVTTITTTNTAGSTVTLTSTFVPVTTICIGNNS